MAIKKVNSKNKKETSNLEVKNLTNQVSNEMTEDYIKKITGEIGQNIAKSFEKKLTDHMHFVKEANDYVLSEVKAQSLQRPQESLTYVQPSENIVSNNSGYSKIGSSIHNDCNCNGGYKSKCCCYELILSRVRVIKDQGKLLEQSDGGIIDSKMEMIFYASADGVGVVHPNLTSWIQIGEKSNWLPVNRLINRISFPENSTKTVQLNLEAMEFETTPTNLNPLTSRPELGSNSSIMNINCSCTPPPVIIEVRLDDYGKGGGIVEGEIIARKVNCCC